KCSLSNNSPKTVGSFVVLWTVTMASGQVITSAVAQDHTFIRSAPKLEPGQSTEVEDVGSIKAGPGNSIVKIEVGIDYVQFLDGTQAGKDAKGVGRQLSYRRIGADDFRKHLLGIYRQSGQEALIQELEA